MGVGSPGGGSGRAGREGGLGASAVGGARAEEEAWAEGEAESWAGAEAESEGSRTVPAVVMVVDPDLGRRFI